MQNFVNNDSVRSQAALTAISPKPKYPADVAPSGNATVDILNRFAVSADQLSADSGSYTNFLGITTDCRIIPSSSRLDGTIQPGIPNPDDGVYGGAAEYGSVLTALESRIGKQTHYTAVELGAGWGPWIAAVGVVGKRVGFDSINLVGVEADANKCKIMDRHMYENGLLSGVRGGSTINTKIIHGAAWSEDTTLYFPVIDAYGDHGAGATAEASGVDYRGFDLPKLAVPAFGLPTICGEFDVIDYMHWDIQGAEWPVAESGIDFLNSHVRYLFIGTHSRVVEGKLLELFYNQKWNVLMLNPCAFTYDLAKPSIEGMTTTDGEIFVCNPKFM